MNKYKKLTESLELIRCDICNGAGHIKVDIGFLDKPFYVNCKWCENTGKHHNMSYNRIIETFNNE